jgi:ubiquinone/menaquinone biosynthesis C-methylase UbiE
VRCPLPRFEITQEDQRFPAATSELYGRLMDRYAIKGGRVGYDRLKLLAQGHRQGTVGLLQKAEVGLGMECVDVGCGGGEVTFDLSGMVGPVGRVVGIDMDKTVIDLARGEARARRLDNVDFAVTDVTAWDEPETYDVAYSRFLLQHLADPVDLLRRMYRSLRPGGVLIVEDTDFDGFFCHPPNDGFAFFTWAYKSTVTRRGGDPTIGRKLQTLSDEAGLPTGELSAVLPIRRDGEEKGLSLMTLEATAASIEAEQVASRAAIDAAIGSLRTYTSSRTSVIGGPNVVQLRIRRS